MATSYEFDPVKSCPLHIDSNTIRVPDKFATESNRFHHYFQVHCSCSSLKFILLIGSKRTVYALCNECRKEICLYDLEQYPAATKSRGVEIFSVHEETMHGRTVYVGYEYGALDEDQEFDRNDITWFELFVEKEGAPMRIFSDESA